MPVKGSSEGYVFFNKQRKRWNAQYIGYNAKTGKTQVKTKSFKTEEDAKKYLDTIMYQKENPLYIEHNGIPLCEVMRANLNLKLDTNQIGDAQYTRVSDTIAKLEKTPLGKKNIDEITSDELQIFTDYLLSTNLNDCKYRNVYLIQMYMGLRIGETLALTIHDIDLKNKKMNIQRTLTTDENRNVTMGKETKNYAGKRVLPIPNFIYSYIIEQMQVAELQQNNDEKLLFKPQYSNYTKRKNVNYELKNIFKNLLGVTDIRTHNLRHTYGTRCIEAGMAPVVVQKLMGHKDISVTLNTYTSVLDKFKESEIDKVNKYYMNENLISNNNIKNNDIMQIEDR